MKTLHISTPLSWRGGEGQMAYLTEGLRERGHEVLVACTQGGAVEGYCVEEEYVFFPLRRALGSMWDNAQLIKRICRNYKIDLIHAHDAKGHTIAFVSSLMGNKTPIVVSRRVDFPVKRNPFSLWKYNHSRISRIICVSEAIKQITGESIRNKRKLAVVYDGVETDIPLTEEDQGDLHVEFGYPPSNWVVGNVAALAPHKDLFTWVDAAKLMLEKEPQLSFLLVGEGPVRRELERYIEREEMEGHITLAGFREDAKALTGSFDVFMNSSKTEGLCTSILDAYVRRVPVVATNAGGIPEIVRHEQTGLLAPVKDAVQLAEHTLKILYDNDLKNALTTQAAEWVKNFDDDVMVERTLEVYQGVI